MAAPGAVAISKIIFPEETKSVKEEIKIETKNKNGNILFSITEGTVEGVKLAVNVGAMLLVFLAHSPIE